jgi:hypothetical protein
VAKSPIENRLEKALWDVAGAMGIWRLTCDGARVQLAVCETTGRPVLARPSGEKVHLPFQNEFEREALVISQPRAAGYSIDILLVLRIHGRPWDQYVAVECDGHDWHERTPQQASRDRARDREIATKCGVTPIRFTGSEIVRDAELCAREVIELALSMSERSNDEASYAWSRTRAVMMDWLRSTGAGPSADDLIAAAICGLG